MHRPARPPDVAIIGGGIVGTATAAMLARRGVSVALYERTSIAAAASGRNSGVVQRPFDPALSPLYHESLGLYRELEELTDGAFQLGAEPAGLLVVAHARGAAEDEVRSIRAAFPDAGATLLDPDEVRRLEPELATGVWACRIASIGYPVPPALATRSYEAVARAFGATIRVAVVARPEIVDGRAVGVRLGGPSGPLEPAGIVLVAAGPWSPGVIDPGGRWRPIRPLWGVVVDIALERPPGHVFEEAGVEESTDGGGEVRGPAVGSSLVTAAGRSSVGSTFLDEEPDPVALTEPILRRAAAFAPAIGDAPVLGVRACPRPLAADGVPLIGPIPGIVGLWIAAGHGPWGISTGPATARIVSDAILGMPDAIPATFDPGRFGPIG